MSEMWASNIAKYGPCPEIAVHPQVILYDDDRNPDWVIRCDKWLGHPFGHHADIEWIWHVPSAVTPHD